MRELRNLKQEMDDSPIVNDMKRRCATMLSNYFTPEEKAHIKSYIDSDPVNWWIKFDQDNDRQLGRFLHEAGYGQEFLGEHYLEQTFLDIIRSAVEQ